MNGTDLADIVKESFQGTVIVIDDHVNDDPSEGNDKIVEIVANLRDNGFIIAAYTDIPKKLKSSSFNNASFAIFDWDMFGKLKDTGIDVGDALKDQNKKDLLKLIKDINDETFVPIFIFSNDTSKISDELKECIPAEKMNKIFIKTKDQVIDMVSLLSTWIEDRPSVYAFKKLDFELKDAKYKMFNDLLDINPSWTSEIWKYLDDDCRNTSHEFGIFLLNNIIGRINSFNFEAEIFQSRKDKINDSELKKIYEYTFFMQYKNKTYDGTCMGDLYKLDEDKKIVYYLNIDPECAQFRADGSSSENMIIHVLKGTELKDVASSVKIEENKIIIDKKEYLFEDLKSDQEMVNKINRTLDKHHGAGPMWYNGAILSKVNKCYIPCINDCGEIKTINFDLNIIAKSKSELGNAFGRVLPPHINIISQKTAQYLMRTGSVYTPFEILSSRNNDKIK